MREGSINSSGQEDVEQVLKGSFDGAFKFCPGMIGLENAKDKLGYLPKGIVMSEWPWKISSSDSCLKWHCPTEKL